LKEASFPQTEISLNPGSGEANTGGNPAVAELCGRCCIKLGQELASQHRAKGQNRPPLNHAMSQTTAAFAR